MPQPNVDPPISTDSIRCRNLAKTFQKAPTECSLPLMLRILTLQLRFDTGVMLAQKIGKILRDLNRPHTWRQNVYAKEHATHSDTWRFHYIEQFLNTQRNERWRSGF